VFRPRPTPVPGALRAELIEMLDYRDQVMAEIVARGHQLRHLHGAFLRQRAEAALTALREEAKTLAWMIEAKLNDDVALRQRADLLRSVPAVGPLTAAMLVVHMPELGTLGDKQAASLAGVAPFARDSGTLRGVRTIHGGRTKVRQALFHIARAGLIHNPVLKAFYDGLVKRGKPGKVALVACMRKVLVILNTLLRTGQKWNPAYEKTKADRAKAEKKAREAAKKAAKAARIEAPDGGAAVTEPACSAEPEPASLCSIGRTIPPSRPEFPRAPGGAAVKDGRQATA
jgi:transposase